MSSILFLLYMFRFSYLAQQYHSAMTLYREIYSSTNMAKAFRVAAGLI